jgi:hypothetical protein
MTTLVHALQQNKKRYGLQTMCEGGGMANVTIVERLTRSPIRPRASSSTIRATRNPRPMSPKPSRRRAVTVRSGGVRWRPLYRGAAPLDRRRRDRDDASHAADRLICDRQGKVLGIEVVALHPSQHARQQALYGRVSPYVPHNHGRTERALRAMREMEERHGTTLRLRARAAWSSAPAASPIAAT